jgi:alanyl aminopeptidase
MIGAVVSLRMLRSSGLLLVPALTLACSAVPGPREADAMPRGRLPGHVRPLHYALQLAIVPEREVLLGYATIAIEVDRPADTLWLHGRDLQVSGAYVQEAASGNLWEGRWEQVGGDGLAAIRLPKPIGPGRVTLSVWWSATLGRTLRGLYRVDVGDDAYAFTQFEPLAARRAFPCFDEPAFKTPFDVTMLVRRKHVAIASTPVVAEQEIANRMRQIRFATTPKLPTYLLAWAWPTSSASSTWSTRTRSSTSSPSPTSAPAPWRTSAPSPSASTCCCSIRLPRQRSSGAASPTSWPTSWPTSGSETSSPCPGGTTSG